MRQDNTVDLGVVQIHKKVIGDIAAASIKEISGVELATFGIIGSIAEAFGYKNYPSVSVTNAHALAAAASHGFDDHRIFDLLGDLQCRILGFDNAIAPGRQRHAHFSDCFFRDNLIAHFADTFRGRTDKLDMAGFANFSEMRVFRQETIAGMDG